MVCRRWTAPINFGENDNFWGLLVEGFTHPSYGMNYNPPYYRALFEDYGFKTLYTQLTNHLEVYKPFPERFYKIAKWVTQKPGYEFKHLKVKEIEKFAADFMEIYNDAWRDFENFVPITHDTIFETFQKNETPDGREPDMVCLCKRRAGFLYDHFAGCQPNA